MLTLGLLGMYFDAAVVFVNLSSLFSDWLWPYCGSPRFFGPTDGPDSNNIDFYNFWQDAKLLVFSSKSPKQSHSSLF